MAIKSRLARNVGIVVIAVPMLLYGASSFESGAEGQPVVQVGDRSVNQATFDREVELSIEAQRDIFGPEAVQSDEFRRSVSQRLMLRYAQDLLLQERAAQVGLVPVDPEVLEIIHLDERFQEDGVYSPELFDSQVSDKRLYLRQLRERLGRRKLDQVFSGSEIVAESISSDLAEYLIERRIVRKLSIPLEYGPDLPEIQDADIESFYDQNLGQYTLPARFKLEYIAVTPDLFEEDIVVDEEQLRIAQEQREQSAAASEERQLGLIVLESESDANAAVARIAGGEDFGQVARELSLDAGSRDVGGDIGLLARSDLDEEISGVVFDAAVGDVVGPFDSDGSFLVFEVRGMIGGHVDDFFEIKDQLVASVKKEQAEILVSSLATELEEKAFEAFDRLDVVAEDLGLELQATDWVENAGSLDDLEYPLDDTSVLREVYKTEFVESRLNSGLIRREDGSYLVARGTAYEPPRQQTLPEVREEIVDTILRQEALAAKVEEISVMIESQQKGEVVPGLPFAEQSPLTISLDGDLPNDITERQRGLVYSIGESLDEARIPAYAIEYDREKDAIVVLRLEEILPGEASEEEIQQAIDVQAVFSSSMLLLGYLAELESQYGLTFYTNEADSQPGQS